MNIPEGWKLVPIEPTKEIIDAWENATWEPYPADTNDETANWIVGRANYKAMISAAPTPLAQKDEPVYLTREPETAGWHEITQIDAEGYYARQNWPIRKLYTRPQSDEMRRAAEKMANLESYIEALKATNARLLAELRKHAALEKGK